MPRPTAPKKAELEPKTPSSNPISSLRLNITFQAPTWVPSCQGEGGGTWDGPWRLLNRDQRACFQRAGCGGSSLTSLIWSAVNQSPTYFCYHYTQPPPPALCFPWPVRRKNRCGWSEWVGGPLWVVLPCSDGPFLRQGCLVLPVLPQEAAQKGRAVPMNWKPPIFCSGMQKSPL